MCQVVTSTCVEVRGLAGIRSNRWESWQLERPNNTNIPLASEGVQSVEVQTTRTHHHPGLELMCVRYFNRDWPNNRDIPWASEEVLPRVGSSNVSTTGTHHGHSKRCHPCIRHALSSIIRPAWPFLAWLVWSETIFMFYSLRCCLEQ